MRSLAPLWAAGMTLPSSALACAVCFDATDENRQAFVDTTILMTALPLLLMAAGGYWIYRQYAVAAPGR